MENKWNEIYESKKPDEVTWYQPRPDVSLSLILKTKLNKDAPIIDVGAGASTLVDCLIEEGFSNLTALDLSKNALAHSKKRLGEAGEAVSWLVGDITKIDLNKKFGLWHDRAVFHFLTKDEDRQEYLKKLNQNLVKDGFLVISTFSEDGPLKCSGQEIVRYGKDDLVHLIGNGFDLLDFQKETHISPMGMEQNFNYWLFQKK